MDAKLDGAYRFIYREMEDGTRNLLLCGHHDELYRRAERLRFRRDGQVIALAGGAELADGESPEPSEVPRAQRAGVGPRAPGRVFMPWTDRELLDARVPEHLLPAIRACDSDDDLLELAYSAGHLGDFLLGLREALEVSARATAGQPESLPAPAEAAKATEEALRSNDAAAAVAWLEPDELARVMTQPIEDWMIFLHPAQAAVARRRTMSGPARVRGPAGTGKTVVALHRAAYLARRLKRQGDRGQILFTTLIKSLPPVLEGLFARLAPDVAGRVEFAHVHRRAARFLWERGRELRIGDDATLNAAFGEALDTAPGRRLLDSGLTRSYIREEVQYYIKGRVLSSVQQYLELPRTTRGTPLRAEQRRDVWQVAQEYRKACRKRGVRDHDDLLLDALKELNRRAYGFGYAAVIVDEAQDLTEAALRVLMRLVRPGGELLLVGDGQQSIYPGSFSLRSIGLDVRGRSAVLTTCYRSTAEIMDGAMAVMAGHDFDDLEDQPASGERPVTHTRHGPAPQIRSFPSRAAELAWLVDDVRRRVREHAISLGDIAVLCPGRRLLTSAIDHAKLCSADPMCAEHAPGDGDTLHGAACHACLFAAETSCERGNRFLDRSLLVDTFTVSGLGYFS